MLAPGAMLADFSAAEIGAYLKPVVAKDPVLVTDCNEAFAWRPESLGMDGALQGVASKYLPSYLGWRRMIERDGDAPTPQHCLADAIGQ